jgi:hypothetical protein
VEGVVRESLPFYFYFYFYFFFRKKKKKKKTLKLVKGPLCHMGKVIKTCVLGWQKIISLNFNLSFVVKVHF